MRDLVLVGSGGGAAEVVSYLIDLRNCGQEVGRIAGFLAPFEKEFWIQHSKYEFEAGFLGNPETFSYTKDFAYIITFSNPSAKRSLLERLLPLDLDFPSVIHPSAIIAASARIGAGNVIGPHCVIGPACSLGDFNMLTAYSFISHDCKVGSYNFFSSSGMSGGVQIGDANFFGIRATLLPEVRIGSNNVIQAGMIVDKDVGNHETVFYKYKERIQLIQS